MNKTKKELFEENKKLKKEKELYEEYWQIDLMDEQKQTIKLIKKVCYIFAMIFLCASCFIIGLFW